MLRNTIRFLIQILPCFTPVLPLEGLTTGCTTFNEGGVARIDFIERVNANDEDVLRTLKQKVFFV